MDWINALIMGIVQGLAEYLPISSSGHLEICRDLLNLDLTGAESLEFDVMLHVATVLSTIVVLWREFVPLCTSFFTFKGDRNFYYVIKILVSCIPVAVVGLFFKETIEGFFGGGLGVVGICLCVTALLLTFSYFFRTRNVERHTNINSYRGREITMLDAFIIGCAQAVAVLPGLSRSGTTIATGILLGDRREQVAQFSFLMVIIPILGEALLGVKDMMSGEAAMGNSIDWLPLIVGFLASFVVGCIACKWMLEIVKKGKLVWFAVYCLIVGVICIVTGF
ncbi:MAG: undecaprenyl-diphosphate phosphatase [Muribaculaceae bacterium]|nr:undecaprenyl-diphosphate phosphatase [Muribaculaceae bacterium]